MNVVTVSILTHDIAGIGQWPKTQAIKKINKIVVYAGSIVDSVRVTYQVENAPAPVTVQHGGNGGFEALSFEIGGRTYILASKFFVYPRNYLNYSRRKAHCRLWFPACETRPLR